jgi:glycosyltransferase involved in cell wall biosynthesis
MEQFDSIICIGQTHWKGDFQKAVVQLMSELSVRHRVLYVDYQNTVKDLAMGLIGRLDVPVQQLTRLKNPLVKTSLENGSEVYVWTPPLVLPVNWLPDGPHDFLMRYNTGRIVSGLRSVMRELGIKKPLVVNAFNPVLGVSMLHKLNEWATIYYCFDEITAATWISRHGKRYESAYLKKVDAIVTTSETLRMAKSLAQPNTYCVKNGVNFDLFHQARQLAEAQPPTRPIVGYLGTADNRIDLDLVAYCVQSLPDILFQFVGEVNDPAITHRLGAYPNVEFIPPHQPADLPAFLAKMTVAMIPFVCNEHTYTIYPLKINEYLAAGLPVVSTPFSVLDDFNGVVELASSPAEFARALRHAFTDYAPDRIHQRVAMAKSNSWTKRAEEFEWVIDQL